MEDIVYTDYANWRLENDEVLSALISRDSHIVLRFKHVLDVLNYLYDKRVEQKDTTIEEDNIFETGFYYIFDLFTHIVLILETNFKNDIDKMEQYAKTVNLLLYAVDFQGELLNMDEEVDEAHMQKLYDFEQQVLGYLEKNQEAPDTLFGLLDDISTNIFETLGVEYYSIADIFYEIADEFGLIDESEYLIYEV